MLLSIRFYWRKIMMFNMHFDLKRYVVLCVAFFLSACVDAKQSAQANTQTAQNESAVTQPKVLIAYLTRTKNTEALAKMIQQRVDGELRALALQNPQLFSKVACLSAYPEEKLMEHMVKDKKQLQHLRFFISHGTDDAVIPLEWGRKAADLLYDLSCYFTFREYMNGHGVNQKNYMDLMEFFRK